MQNGEIRIEYYDDAGKLKDQESLVAPPYGGTVYVKPSDEKLAREDVRLVHVMITNRPKDAPRLEALLLAGSHERVSVD